MIILSISIRRHFASVAISTIIFISLESSKITLVNEHALSLINRALPYTKPFFFFSWSTRAYLWINRALKFPTNFH